MTSTVPSASIIFLPRERYELTAESLATMLDNTAEPFELFVVAPAGPDRDRRELDEVLERRPATTVLEADAPLLPAASKNLALGHVTGDFVAIVENDVLYPSGWLEGLIAAALEFPADVVSPLIREGRGADEHFDHHLGRIDATSDDEPVRIRGIDGPRNALTERTQVDFVEQHCLLYRRTALAAITPFDEELNTRDEVDVSMALWAAGQTIVVEPAVRINYVPPTTSPADDELDYYLLRWDEERATASRQRIRARWNLADTPGDLGFVRARNNLVSLPHMHDTLAGLVAEGGRTILLENGEWFGTEVTGDLDLVPFTDCQGHFGGFPSDDAESMEEFNRAVAAGARQLIIGWPADWWLDHLPALRDHLEHHARLVRDDARLRVYALEGL
ncbi:MAG: glycosyltransferase family 2 protein [Acidimicrobiales bacterium]